MGELLERRRADTSARIQELRKHLTKAEQLCGSVACVYATGSFGRGEASHHSDLDLFIVGTGTRERRSLPPLDEFLIKAELIQATRKLGIPDFSGGGEYLTHYTIDELVGTLGTPEDDAKNTFTARLLLLLESSPLLGQTVYRQVIQDVIAAYWRDYEGHESDFIPAFLANDVLRMWRTFCVNYEARTKTEPPEKKAKRKLKNYKLKHSRLLTCYSAMLYLLARFASTGTITPKDTENMLVLSPTQRMEWITSQAQLGAAHSTVASLLTLYEEFLAQTDASEDEMVARFLKRESSSKYLHSTYKFGDLIFDLLEIIGAKNRFHRLLVV